MLSSQETGSSSVSFQMIFKALYLEQFRNQSLFPGVEIGYTVPRQRLTHFVCAQNLKNVSIFGEGLYIGKSYGPDRS